MSINWGKAPTKHEKLEETRRKYRYECSHCGWKILIYPFEKRKRKICVNCGHYVYSNKKEEFKDKLKGAMK